MDDPNYRELEFEGDVPQDLICSICLSPAKEPQQTRCTCAKLYCLECVKQYAEHSKLCPTCRQCLDVFPDGLSARRIRFLKVKCVNAGSGCLWVKELGELGAHRSVCEYATVLCSNGCGEKVILNRASLHQCPLQRVTCPYCEKEGTLREIAGSHLELCPERMLSCPNGCGPDKWARKNLTSHRAVCPKETVPCPYASVGCASSFPRENLSRHKLDSIQQHLDLAMEYITSTFRPHQQVAASLRESSPLPNIGNTAVDELHARLCNLEANRLVAPVVIRMDNFLLRKTIKEPWYSPGFYTHPGGYKACLRVYANGFNDAEGTHLSVFINLMRGKNDHALVWPLRADFTISLLNQLNNAQHKEYVAALHSDNEEKFNSRVVETEIASSARGLAKFIVHQDLQLHKHRQYLKDDALYFKVAANVHPVCKPWLLAADTVIS